MGLSTIAERPPSPPHSNDGDPPVGLYRSGPALRELFCTPPRSIRPALGTSSRPVSNIPEGGREHAINNDDTDNCSPIRHQYEDPTIYHIGPIQTYLSQPGFQEYYQHTNPHTPPPTYDPGMHSRSRRLAGSKAAGELPHASASPRPTRQPKSRKGTPGGDRLVIDQPLSVLTKDYDIPLKDIHAWVTRPADVRHEEVAQKNGHIVRPMNSFMLYRSAYAERVKKFSMENNHQVVSKISGASWRLEPPEVKSMFDQWSKIERDNHEAAHPNYKFEPNKGGKKRKSPHDDESDTSDSEWVGHTPKRVRNSRKTTSRSQTSTPFDTRQSPRTLAPLGHMAHPNVHPSSYHATNPYGQIPMQMLAHGIGSGYLETRTTPLGQGWEDVGVRRVNYPPPPYLSNGQWTGHSQGGYQNLTTLGSAQAEYMVDPQLVDWESNMQELQCEQVSPGYAEEQNYHQYSSSHPPTQTAYGYPNEPDTHPGMVTLTDAHTPWDGSQQPGSDFDAALRSLERTE